MTEGAATNEPSGSDPAYNRVLLAGMLDEAAELEHSLCCQYLYAAFSTKRGLQEGLAPGQIDLVRDWATSLLMVARQEMEHLGLVNNILTAIGEAPHLVRPDFPLTPQYYELKVKSKLTAFSQDAMRRFVLFELPDDLEPERAGAAGNSDTGARLAAAIGGGSIIRSASSIRSIDRLLVECDQAGGLFIGPASAQFVTGENNIQAVRGAATQGISIYDIDLNGVFDLKSARAAVQQIILEGEGPPEHRQDSHFGRFLTVLEQLEEESRRDPAFAPARNVIDDPRTWISHGDAQKSGTLITNDLTNRVSRAFDLAYGSLMLLLMRFFASAGQSQSDAQALESAAFFPMMTMVIRPLGEIMTELPATDEPGGPCAGPSFRFERRLALLPHREAAFQVIHQDLETLYTVLAKVALDPKLDRRIAERLDFVSQNVWRIAHDFAGATNLGRTS